MDEPRLLPLDARRWEAHADGVLALEAESYERARRDSRAYLDRIVHMQRAVCLIALAGHTPAGFCLAGPLEEFDRVGGVAADPAFGAGDTLYSADLTVGSRWRGRGLARALKAAQVERARALGYRGIAGRNRVGLADAMWRVNRGVGAVEIARLENAYPDGPEPRACIYYRIEL